MSTAIAFEVTTLFSTNLLELYSISIRFISQLLFISGSGFIKELKDMTPAQTDLN